MEQNNKFDIKKVRVHRTLEGTVFEAVFAIVAIIVWELIIWLIHQAPDIVPTHSHLVSRRLASHRNPCFLNPNT